MFQSLLTRRTLAQLAGGALVACAMTVWAPSVVADAVTIDKIKQMGKLRIGVEATYPPLHLPGRRQDRRLRRGSD